MLTDVFEFVLRDLCAEALHGLFVPAQTVTGTWLRRLAWTGAAGVGGGLALAFARDGAAETAGAIVAGVGFVLWAVCGFAAAVTNHR